MFSMMSTRTGASPRLLLVLVPVVAVATFPPSTRRSALEMGGRGWNREHLEDSRRMGKMSVCQRSTYRLSEETEMLLQKIATYKNE